MDKEQNKLIAVISAILTVVYAILFFVIPFPKGVASYISFAFTVLSFIVCGIVSAYSFADAKNVLSKVYKFPAVSVVYIYAVVQFLLSLLIYIFDGFFPVPFYVPFGLFVVILGVALVVMILACTTEKMVKTIEKKAEEEISGSKSFRLNMSRIVDLCEDGESKKILEKLNEEFRYSDPVSCTETAELEMRIQEELKWLGETIAQLQYAEILEVVQKIRAMLLERNRICKMSK